MKLTSKIAVIGLLALAVVGVIILKKHSLPSPAVPVANTGEKDNPTSANTASLPKLIDLGADKCIPCKMMAPILEELKTEFDGKLKVEFIDVWKNSGAGKAYGIEIIPTQIFIDASGQERFRHTGFFSKEDILAKWKELGTDLQSKSK